ncbi:hypothetical protein TNCV_169131 [Trichonephila clavipes]|nr:hypothetical protein TNCV_169131 [Trichonephila clavipes]
MHRSPTQPVFSGTGAELVVCQPRSDTLTTRLLRPGPGSNPQPEGQRQINHATQTARVRLKSYAVAHVDGMSEEKKPEDFECLC